MFKKIRLIKKVLKLVDELKEIKKANEKTFDELEHFLESAKLLYPKLGGIIESIIELVKNIDNKKV